MTGIRLQRRSLPDRLRYLAEKLRQGHQNRVAVMIALEAMADEAADPVTLRGIDYFLDQMAGSLTAHAEQPYEIRDIAQSLRSKARAIRAETGAPPKAAPGPAHLNCIPGEALTCQRAESGRNSPCRSQAICDYLTGEGR